MDVSSLLKLMDQKKASDLFITAGLPPSIKVDGRVAAITPTPLTPQDTAEIVASMMTPAQRDEFEATRECNFAVSESGIGRFRASAFYQRGQVGVVLRRIETYIPTIEELKLPPILKNLSMTKRGLIIFATRTDPAISSPSRIPSSSCTTTRTVSSPSARWESTPSPTRWRSRTRCARLRM